MYLLNQYAEEEENIQKKHENKIINVPVSRP